MIRKLNSLLLVALLTFLQCLAPLLHAHAGGLHSLGAGHVHFDVVTVAPARAHAEFRVDLADSPSVSAPAEFRRDQATPGGEQAGLGALVPYPVPLAAPSVEVATPPYFWASFRRFTPPAQAPPVAL